MAGVSKRLALALRACRPEAQAADPRTAAGQAAEDDFKTRLLATQTLFSDLRVFCNLRPPNTKKVRTRREIDVVVATQQQLTVLELKNWSGTLEVDSGGEGIWRQRQRSGNVVEHANPVTATWEKALTLKSYLEAQGAQLPQGYLEHRVIFTNPNCHLPDAVCRNPNIVNPLGYQQYVHRFERGWLASFVSHMLPETVSHVLVGNKVTGNEFAAIVRALEHVPTWDVVVFEGEENAPPRVVTGDVRDVAGLKLSKKIRQERNRIDLGHQRSAILGVGWAIAGYEPSIEMKLRHRLRGREDTDRRQVPVDSKLTIQPAGSREELVVPLNDIVSISLSV